MGRDEDCRTGPGEDDPADSDGASAAPSRDDLFRALASSPRRRVLFVLLEWRESSVEELSDALAGWRAATRDEPVGLDERDRIRTRLVHVELPTLEECGLVTVGDDGDVTLVDAGASARRMIRLGVELE
ncbi:DUF7344 domain-containing protein [Halorarum salinum]|uniref:ArsR family transcriptional regulator n=1 Tax=Halorarum salinum TaxID=2743089 RepID=A0A7D5LDI9_9EURY|nr:ArsR family transcriptional regulator [Halobaculum salinum]QLG63389.1 ArsR family transcriptional regulator [Halobaculum salinum]